MTNTAPVLDNTLTRVNTIYGDSSTGNIPISFFNSGFNTNGQFVSGATDVDISNFNLGIAIIGVTGVAGGIVEFSNDNGLTWITVGTPPAGQAIVFKGDTLLRYTPPADANGIRTITFHTWDGTGGFNSGDFVNIAAVGTGGSSPFSSVIATHTLNIAPDENRIITNFEGFGAAYAEAVGTVVNANGKIVVVGGGFRQNSDSDTSIVIARYNTNGSLDTSLSSDGKLAINLPGIGTGFSSGLVIPSRMIVDTNGKYVISGAYTNFNSFIENIVIRLNPDFTIDTSFGGSNGWVKSSITNNGSLDSEDAGTSIVMQGTNILLSTDHLNPNGVLEFGMFRYTSAGVLDSTFGTNGLVTTNLGADIRSGISRLLVQADGKILAVGLSKTQSIESNILATIVRYNANGTIDTNYGLSGVVKHDIGIGKFAEDANAQLLSDDSILITSSSSTGNFDSITGNLTNYTSDLILAKINPNGNLDTTFGGGDGIVTTDFGALEQGFIVSATANAIYIAGKTFDFVGDIVGKLLVAKYSTNGVLDTSFGTGGKFTTYLPGTQVLLADITIQADGKIVLTSSVSKQFNQNSFDSFFSLLRLNTNGTLDTTFNGENNAPELDNSLTRVSEMFQGDVGTVVPFSFFNKALITSPTFNYIDGALDPDGKDASQLGIAIVAVGGTSLTGNVTAGSVEFSMDNGATWQLHTPEVGKAVVFSANTLLRYTPEANTSGTRTITFHTWDGTGGFTSGQKIDLAILNNAGGTSPFSAKTAKHDLIIYAPTLGSESGESLLANTSSNLTIGGFIKGLGGGDELIGSFLGDKLDGGNGNDSINGFEGVDTVTGGDGDDFYFVNIATSSSTGNTIVLEDIIIEDANQGVDTIELTNLNLIGPSVLSGITNLVIASNIENLYAGTNDISSVININITGNAGNNEIYGSNGSNRIDGGIGNDRMVGQAGDDVYVVDSSGDVVDESLGQGGSGIDRVESTISYTLGENIEQLTLLGTTAINGTGNSLNNTITGNTGNNVIIGGAGVDTMTGGLGNDVYEVTEVNDVIIESSGAGSGNDTVWIGVSGYTLANHVENLNFGGSTEAYTARGNALANLITGNAGNNVIIGGAGVDTMTGGLGDDTYEVTEVNDVIIESSGVGSGNDTVWIGVSGYTLANHVENLNFGGSTEAYTARGNALANLITGNAGNNVIIGGAGVDTMTGGLGDDTYEVTEVNDVIIESSGVGSGNDTVWIGVSGYTLANHVENLNFGGSTEAYTARGNALNNVIIGNAGNNVIIGGAGVDTMTGGLGNDTYEVTEVNDVIIESSGVGSGNDTVWIGVSGYTLANHVENLNFGGSTEAYTARGNALNNVIIGNAGNNVIIGGAGVDTMSGGLGNDTYEVTEVNDVIIESSGVGSGNDTVWIGVSGYTLANHVENLNFGGSTEAYTARGNALNNVIIGNAGNNVIIGGAGVDTMTGGLGNDTYEVTEVNDVIIESSGVGSGNDTVWIGVSGYTLANHVENLNFGGSTEAYTARGNALNNVIIGNAGNNVIIGGAGVDTMTGGLGADTFDFNNIAESLVGASRDVITDFSVAQGDLIDLSTIDANTSVANDQAFLASILASGDFNAIGQLRLVGNVLSGNTDSNFLTSEFEIQLTGVTTLTSAAFVL